MPNRAADHLVTKGPFSFTRNPIYLGNTMLMIGIGIFGSRGDELLTEQSEPGRDFLSEVASAWEKGSEPLAAAGARTVQLRFGTILANQGGALAKMLPFFRLGLGGRTTRSRSRQQPGHANEGWQLLSCSARAGCKSFSPYLGPTRL